MKNYKRNEGISLFANKQGKGGMKVAGWSALAVSLVLAVIFSAWYFDWIPQNTVDENGKPKADGHIETSDTSPDLQFAAVDKYAKATSVPVNIIYKVNDGNILIDYDGTIADLGCHDKVEYLVNASGYYSVHGVVDDVPCDPSPKQSVELMAFDTAPDIQIYNQDDGTLNTATASEALIANAVDTTTIKVYPSFRKGIQGAHVYLDLVGTNVDTVTSSLGGSISQPSVFTHNSSAGRSTADEVYIFPVTSLEYKDSIVQFTATIDMAGTAYGLNNGTIGLMDQDWYVSDDGTFKYGFETDGSTKVDVAQKQHRFDELFFTDSS